MDRSYQNGPGGNWNARVKWFGQKDGRVKLKFETPKGEWEEIHQNETFAKIRFDWFKREYPYQKAKDRR